jgi:hypothetical protein
MAGLEALTREFRGAQARVASLSAEERAAEGMKATLETEVEVWRGEDAESQRIREQCHWLAQPLGVLAERRMRGSGEWEDEVKGGLRWFRSWASLSRN